MPNQKVSMSSHHQSVCISFLFLKKWANPLPLFCLILFFSNTNFTEKILLASAGFELGLSDTTTGPSSCRFSFLLLLLFKGNSHYCIFHMLLQQTVVFLQGDRKFPISVLTQASAENADHCI